MLVIGDVISLPPGNKARKYGEFGLPIYLSQKDIKKLESIIQTHKDIELAFSYFTNLHLEEAKNNGGIVYLTNYYEKEHNKSNAEFEDDVIWLKKILGG